MKKTAVILLMCAIGSLGQDHKDEKPKKSGDAGTPAAGGAVNTRIFGGALGSLINNEAHAIGSLFGEILGPALGQGHQGSRQPGFGNSHGFQRPGQGHGHHGNRRPIHGHGHSGGFHQPGQGLAFGPVGNPFQGGHIVTGGHRRPGHHGVSHGHHGQHVINFNRPHGGGHHHNRPHNNFNRPHNNFHRPGSFHNNQGFGGHNQGFGHNNAGFADKPGFCPVVRPQCPATRLHLNQPQFCDFDRECPDTQKCCDDACIKDSVCKPIN